MDNLTSIAAGLQQLAEQNKPVDPLAGTEKLLVVDDEPFILEIAVDALTEFGYTVKGVTSAADAIQTLVDGFKPDMMCCDIVLPGGMNGVELARKIYEVMPDMKVLLISGYGAGLLDGAINQDGFRLLSKPYLIEDLGKRVRDILDNRL